MNYRNRVRDSRVWLRVHSGAYRIMRFLTWVLLAICSVVNSAVAASVPKLPGYAVVPLKAGGFNRLALPTTLKGNPILFLLDTGAALSSIDRESVKKWKLRPPARELGIASQRMMNGRKAEVVWLPDLRSAEMNFGALPMTVLPVGNHFRDYQQGALHGLIGSDILTLYQAIVNCQTGHAYFKTDADVSIDLAQVLEPVGYRRVPLTKRGGLYYIECKLKKFNFLLLVDTGAPVTVLKKKTIDLFGIASQKTEMRQRSLNGSSVHVYRVQSEDHQLSVAGLPIKLEVTATDDPLLNRQLKSDELGIFGCELLLRHGAIIDYATLTLYLRPPK